MESARRGKQISEVLGEALEQYLASVGDRGNGGSVVQETWGSLSMSKGRVRQILDEGDSFLDA